MPDAQTVNAYINAYGVSNIVSSVAGSGDELNMGYWIANILFGTIGTCIFGYGWKHKSVKPTVIGLVFFIYPWFVTNTLLTVVIGIGLCAALYYWRD